jgi:benzodiazapine receptor
MNFLKRYSSEILGALLCLSLGFVSGYRGNAGGSLWYAQLNKPSFNPPGWIFGPVWTILYICMGIALVKIWKQKSSQAVSLFLFTVQLVLNIIWTPIFFACNQIGLALSIIIALWLSLLGLLFSVLQNRVAFLLLLPYFLWVSFALILNYSLFLLN